MYIALPYYSKFLILLTKHNVRYILVGGAAVHSHGYERGTNDVDIWVSHEHENMERLFKAIREFGFDTSEIEHHKFSDKDSPIKLVEGENKIDIIHNLTNVVTFEEAWAKISIRDAGDFKYNLIDYYHLEQIKLAAGRPQDLADVANMRKNRAAQEGKEQSKEEISYFTKLLRKLLSK